MTSLSHTFTSCPFGPGGWVDFCRSVIWGSATRRTTPTTVMQAGSSHALWTFDICLASSYLISKCCTQARTQVSKSKSVVRSTIAGQQQQQHRQPNDGGYIPVVWVKNSQKCQDMPRSMFNFDLWWSILGGYPGIPSETKWYGIWLSWGATSLLNLHCWQFQKSTKVLHTVSISPDGLHRSKHDSKNEKACALIIWIWSRCVPWLSQHITVFANLKRCILLFHCDLANLGVGRHNFES